ncbi:MAG: DUF4230 domain-containing protein, partial [Bacteroidota bacterium]
IPIEKIREKNEAKNKIHFVFKANTSVSGYIDFASIKADVHADSVVHFTLPPAKMSPVYIDFSKTEEYLIDGRFRIFGKEVSNTNYGKAFKHVQTTLRRSQREVEKRAIANGILEETETKAKAYLQQIAGAAGYQATYTFTESDLQPDTALVGAMQRLENAIESGDEARISKEKGGIRRMMGLLKRMIF